MQCEFEEKQYETYINFELRTHNAFFVPGQVLEHNLGFDAAFFTTNSYFWSYLGYLYTNSKLKGTKIDDDMLDIVEKKINCLPKFNFNLFVQYKRPNYMTTRNSNEWSCWGEKYYRYNIVSHQQKALEQLDQKIGDSGIVVYACPAFYTFDKLYENHSNGNLVSNSNFAQVIKLKGHHSYTFISSGSTGRAHSEEEAIESYDFLERISNLSEKETNSRSNVYFVNETARIIDDIMEQDEYHAKFRSIVSLLISDTNLTSEILYSLVKIHVFSVIKNVNCLFGFEKRRL